MIVSWDYVAGLIDGEGCFSAYHPQNTRLHLSITNTDKEALERVSAFITDKTGFSIPVRPSDNSSHRIPCYRIYLGPPVLRIIIPVLRDRLLIKEFELETMAEILEIVKDRKQWLEILKHKKQKHNKRSPEELRKLEELIGKLQWANKGYR